MAATRSGAERVSSSMSEVKAGSFHSGDVLDIRGAPRRWRRARRRASDRAGRSAGRTSSAQGRLEPRSVDLGQAAAEAERCRRPWLRGPRPAGSRCASTLVQQGLASGSPAAAADHGRRQGRELGGAGGRQPGEDRRRARSPSVRGGDGPEPALRRWRPRRPDGRDSRPPAEGPARRRCRGRQPESPSRRGSRHATRRAAERHDAGADREQRTRAGPEHAEKRRVAVARQAAGGESRGTPSCKALPLRPRRWPRRAPR